MSLDSVFPLYQDWEVSQLGDVCKRGGGNVQTGPFGSQLHASDYVVEGIPSVMPQNIGDNRILEAGIARITEADAQRLSKYRLLEGDIIYSRRGDVERRALVRESEEGWLCGTGCLRIRFGEGVVYPAYAAHYLGHPAVREWIIRHAHGATMPNLNTRILSELPFVLPPWDAQVSIGDAIEFHDKKINLNRSINQTLEAMAQAIFKSWFVDFDPVKAKIAAIEQGQDPVCAAMRAISGKTDAELDQMPREHHDQLATAAALFPDAMEESELGDVPKRWNVVTLSKMIQLIGGGTPRRSESSYWGGAIPWFSVRDVPEDGNVWVIDTEEKITLAGLQKSSTKLLREGTTIISARGTVGKLALVGTEMAMNQSCYGVVGAEGVGEGFNYFNLKEAVEKLKQNTHGAVFDTITQATFETVLCVRPEDSVMKKFDETVGPLLRCIKSNVLQSRELAALRDALLPRLLSGGVSVETLMNEVAQ
ncbi:TPA: restriction endonuclease subunit S [Stenotrophomonas maltophilia]|nr:restriction endonuclease subunit S [Stenotrophomonas maltophilia]